MNYKSALMQHMIIDFNQSVFKQDLIIVFSQSFDLDQNYINLNHELDKTSLKSCMQNNTAFVYFKHLITKLINSKLLKKNHFWELSALFNQLYALNSYVYNLNSIFYVFHIDFRR